MMQIGIFYKVIVPGNFHPNGIIYNMGNISDTVHCTVEGGILSFTLTFTLYVINYTDSIIYTSHSIDITLITNKTIIFL